MRKSMNPDGRADKSKIGRLPFAIRNAVARMLRDGATAKQVCEFVNASPAFSALRRETGCAPLNAQNVTDWRSGGYIAWCREQQRAERLRALAESAYHIAEATGGSPAGVGSSILAGRLVDMLGKTRVQRMDPLQHHDSAWRKRAIRRTRTSSCLTPKMARCGKPPLLRPAGRPI